MRSSPEERRGGLAALAAAVTVVGVVAAWQGFAWPDTRGWVTDLLAGWTLAGLGLAAAAPGASRGAARLLFRLWGRLVHRRLPRDRAALAWGRSLRT